MFKINQKQTIHFGGAIPYPSTSWSNQMGFYTQASGGQFYLNYIQASITNSVGYNGVTNNYVTTATLSNSSGYSGLNETILANAGLNYNSSSANCSNSGVTTTCDFSSVSTVTINYVAPSTSATLPIEFTTSSANLFLNPAYLIINTGVIPQFIGYIYYANQSLSGSIESYTCEAYIRMERSVVQLTSI